MLHHVLRHRRKHGDNAPALHRKDRGSKSTLNAIHMHGPCQKRGEPLYNARTPLARRRLLPNRCRPTARCWRLAPKFHWLAAGPAQPQGPENSGARCFFFFFSGKGTPCPALAPTGLLISASTASHCPLLSHAVPYWRKIGGRGGERMGLDIGHSTDSSGPRCCASPRGLPRAAVQ